MKQEYLNKILLKGGSLSGTYLIQAEGSDPFVRKEVSLTVNREYGFMRWYSQLKRIQRYSFLFPGIFPELLTYGIDKEDGIAYFDLEYINDSVTAQEFLINTTNKVEIEKLFTELVKVMGRMHETEIESTQNPIELYIYEEIEQKIKACYKNEAFVDFINNKYIYFNGNKVPSLINELDTFREMALRAYTNTTETFTHGNLTLENILYQPYTNRIIFIDPYEENIIDSVFAEYSQIYQSSNSKYELHNAKMPIINGNRVESVLPNYEGLDYFNSIFTDFLENRYSKDDIILIKLLEVSQYTRMLPFKMEFNQDKMLLFYSLGSYLFNDLKLYANR